MKENVQFLAMNQMRLQQVSETLISVFNFCGVSYSKDLRFILSGLCPFSTTAGTDYYYYYYYAFSVFSVRILPFRLYLLSSKPVKPGHYSLLPSHILHVLLTKYGKMAQ